MQNEYLIYIKWKESNLAQYAAKSEDARKSISVEDESTELTLENFDIQEHSFRTPFEIDTDMIIQSRYFPLLSNKTQIFVAPEDCNYRNRNSHTLTVAKLTKNISNGLKLNVDLAEAIAFGHDIGHTAFGHVAEDELDRICQKEYCILNFNNLRKVNPNLASEVNEKYKHSNKKLSKKEFLIRKIPVKDILKNPSDFDKLKRDYMLQENDTRIFNHARQGFRLLCLYAGKNVTAQTLYGIVAHNLGKDESFDIHFNDQRKILRPKSILKEKYDKNNPILVENYSLSPRDATLEAQVVKFADFLAFTIHDYDDAIRAGLINLESVKSKFNKTFKGGYGFEKYFGVPRYTEFVNDFVIHNLNRNLEKITSDNLNKENILEIPVKSSEILSWLHDYIKENVHNSQDTIQRIKREESRDYIRYAYELFRDYGDNPTMKRRLGVEIPEGAVVFSPIYDGLRFFCDMVSFKTDNDLVELGEVFISPKTRGKRYDL